MKLYDIAHPGAVPVLCENNTELTMGECGRGRTETTIPITGNGTEYRAKRTENGIVLVRGDFLPETRCLVTVNTVGGYDRYRRYGILDAKGVETIAYGTIAFGDAGRTNGGTVELVIAEQGAEFRLNSKYASTWYTWTGEEWMTETPEKRNARLALAEVEQGGGEWL